MPVSQGATDFFLIERIFSQLSSTVAIALLKNGVLSYEFYGGKKLGGAGAMGGAGAAGASGAFSASGASAVSGASGASGAFGSAGASGATGSAGPHGQVGHISRATRFNIGTATMLVTGALIVKLMEFGELRLNDSVKKLVPAFRLDGVTIYHLLTHTSGLDFGGLGLPDNYMAKKEFMGKVYAADSLAYPTGGKCALFPYGYSILADIAERATGQSIDELAATLIFAPLGMSSTTYSGAALSDGQYVLPWSHRENRFIGELRSALSTGFNGLYTTVLDLLQLGSAFLNGGEFEGRQVFLESSVEFMMRDITSGRFMRTPVFMIKGEKAAYDCFSRHHSESAVAQTGDTGSILFIDPRRRAVGAALTNSTWVHDSSQNYSNICDILMSM